MKCPICGAYNVCPSCSDWLCDWCGADLAKDNRPESERSAYQHYGYDHYDDDDGYHD